MSSDLLERLRGFRTPVATPVAEGVHLVAQLEGVDFAGFFNSEEFEFDNAFDPRFGKTMVRVASHLLGGDACGVYGYVEQGQMSLLLDADAARTRWADVAELQHFLVGMASSKMTQLLEEPAFFVCRTYAFSAENLVVAYFTWRQQETYLAALDSYCRDVLIRDKGQSPEAVKSLLEGMGPLEKQEILAQNDIQYSELPAWQRYGTGVSLDPMGNVAVDTELPNDESYGAYVLKHLGA